MASDRLSPVEQALVRALVAAIVKNLYAGLNREAA